MKEGLKYFMIGLGSGAFSPVLVWLVGLVQPIAQPLLDKLSMNQSIVSGTAIGTKLVEALTGKFGWTFPEVLIAALGGGVLFFIGKWLYDLKITPDAIFGWDTEVSKMALVIFYATLFGTLVISFAIPALVTIVLLALNSLITAFAVTTVLKLHKKNF